MDLLLEPVESQGQRILPRPAGLLPWGRDLLGEMLLNGLEDGYLRGPGI